MRGGLCLVFAFAIIPKHFQVVYKRDICSTVRCLSAALQPNWTTTPKSQTRTPCSIWGPWCLMACCMEQGLLLSLFVLQKWWVEGSFGGHLVLPPPGSRNISKWSEMQSHCMDGSITQGFQEWSILMQSRNTRREKETKEREKTPRVFLGKKETLRAHFDIHHGENILGKA